MFSTFSRVRSSYPRYSLFRALAGTMSMTCEFKQTPHDLLAIPGPIEVSDEVLYANACPPMSHMSPNFSSVFGDCIRMLRQVLFTQAGQPFIIAGSGTLGWDQIAANLVEPGERALVLQSGYFGDSFEECLTTYGAKVDKLVAPVGTAVNKSAVEIALKSNKYKIVTVTHVDTSTGVLSDVKAIADIAQRVSPDTLIIVDAVCSVGSEEIRMDEWGLDVIMTASQKGLGIPPGLSLVCASERAMTVFESRSCAITSYYASWKKWLPIMKAYEAGSAAYFATPPVNLINALHAALTQITEGSPPLQERFRLHHKASLQIKNAAANLGLKQVPTDLEYAANGMTALYFPESIVAADLLPRLTKKGVVVAGGLHADIKDKYFRIGHMGITVVEPSRGDVNTVIRSLTEALEEAKASKNA